MKTSAYKFVFKFVSNYSLIIYYQGIRLVAFAYLIYIATKIVKLEIWTFHVWMQQNQYFYFSYFLVYIFIFWVYFLIIKFFVACNFQGKNKFILKNINYPVKISFKYFND